MNSEMIRTHLSFDNRKQMESDFEEVLIGVTPPEKRYIERSLT